MNWSTLEQFFLFNKIEGCSEILEIPDFSTFSFVRSIISDSFGYPRFESIQWRHISKDKVQEEWNSSRSR